MKIFGTVQGVGFRPYIYNLADKNEIHGWVNNSGAALVIDLEGDKNKVKEFILNIVHNPPKLSRIEKIEISFESLVGYPCFEIRKSDVLTDQFRYITSDVGVCSECLKEVSDANSRWYQYPFTNCTECGPRYSIIKSLPYDRISTTMESFHMCPSCKDDYNNPQNRRFHAQPTCCLACGPTIALLSQQGKKIRCENEIVMATNLIKQGYILAVKGLGGFHLVCDAENQKSISLLRQRKNRPHKPLAIMAKDMDHIKDICHVSETEEFTLQSNKKPIVILNRKESCPLPKIIAPDTKKLGVMLPYTPLHHMLFQNGINFLVMTSGNISNAPIQYKDDEVLGALAAVADFFLTHNRQIYTPVEDSLVRIFKNYEMVIREGRGYAPFITKMDVKNDILALGAEQKSTFCISKNGYGYMSQYLGDIKNLDTYKLYQNTTSHLTNLIHVAPQIIAYDMHPNFLARQYLDKSKGTKIPVQHHHAHMVSCMVEHKLYKPVIGVIYDGTGYGTDESIWGGEFLIGTRKAFKRVGHFRYINIQGGDQSIKEPWHIALSYLDALGYIPEKYLNTIPEDALRTVQQALRSNLNCYQSSSIGRFFDGISALLGLCFKISYDAQAAIILENILDPDIQDFYPTNIIKENGILQIDYRNIIEGILLDLNIETPLSAISSKFHNSLCHATVQTIQMLSKQYQLFEVVLSGGCFENHYLLNKTVELLLELGIKVFYNQKIPINDSGISIGQLAVADQMV